MGKPKAKSYTQSTLVAAFNAVKNKWANVTQAATKFGIPRQTLSDHVKGKVPEFKKPGCKPMLSPQEEEAVRDYIVYMGQRNFPLRRNDIRTTVVELIKSTGPERVAKCLFNLQKGPTDKWFRGFEGRHPELKWAIPETLEKARSKQSTEYIIDHFFNSYEQILKKYDLIAKPEQIFNADETGIKSQVTTREKAYGLRGEKLYQEKISYLPHITAMTAVSAAGRVLPTFLIYEKNLPTTSVTDEMPSKWLFGCSPNGYMDKELFDHWFTKIFIPNCGSARPVLLIIDNHESHISLKVIEEANAQQIHILGLPAHTTHILQPLDVGVFGVVKKKYNALCVSGGLQNCRFTVTKSYFPAMWRTSLNQAATTSVVKSAFQRSGLYPFDPCAIDMSKIKKVKVVSDINTPQQSTYKYNNLVSAINGEIANSLPNVTHACEKCGRYAPPVSSIVELPAQQQVAFPFNFATPQPSVQTKRRVVPHERVITGEEMKKQVAEKEKRIREGLEAKEERKRKREEKDSLKSKKVRKVIEEEETDDVDVEGNFEISDQDVDNINYKEIEINNIWENPDAHCSLDVNQVDEEGTEEESVCFMCKKEHPPYQGKGKGRRRKDVDWVCCDTCDHWFHCVCLNIDMKTVTSGEQYICPSCTC